MPIYEYVCKKCDTMFEATRSIDDKDEEVQCPLCYEKKCVRIPSMFSSSGASCVPSAAGTVRRFG